MNIKTAYQKFRRWQLNPFDHEFTSRQTNHCCNCGHDFVGNYCPYCSQKSGLGRITWHSVWHSIAEVWGMHSRSLPFTLLQLFLRPGYVISDYINGKRQVSFPPIKMLVLLGVLGVIVDFLTGAIYGMVYSNGEKMNYVIDVFNWLNVHLRGIFPPPGDYLSRVLQWLNTHPDVFSLILLSFLIIPVYCIFRFAPRNPRHTLPQGFFIQVFSTAIFLMMNMLYDTTSMGWLVVGLSSVLIFFTYKQLFGYGTWGTLWRLVMAFVCAFTLLTAMLNINYGAHLVDHDRIDDASGFFLNIPIAFALLVIILIACYLISKPKAKGAVVSSF